MKFRSTSLYVILIAGLSSVCASEHFYDKEESKRAKESAKVFDAINPDKRNPNAAQNYVKTRDQTYKALDNFYDNEERRNSRNKK